MYVIGTAGHVDHGKSTLVTRLTGIDPDRLEQEKSRGLTIELGFAWLTLPSGRDVSVVDVPGHQRFIKHMLAGAGGLDLAVLVIAADEGPREQTREHLAILEALAVPALVVAVSKCDLVDREWLELVTLEVDQLLEGGRFAGAPAVPVSATTGDGLDALCATIDAVLDRTPEKPDHNRPRLGVDRVFTTRGFGTVVTGTLVDGALEVGQEVEFQPGGLRGRVRGLQRHGRGEERLRPGTRAAVNVSGVDVHDVTRGMTLTLPGLIRPVSSLAVRLTAATTLETPVQEYAGVTMLAGTAEREARMRLLDRDTLLPGDEAWALIRLDAPVPVLAGDRVIIRTSNETVGGGLAAMVEPPVGRVRGPRLIQLLDEQLEVTPTQLVLKHLIRAPASAGAGLGATAGLHPDQALEAIAALQKSGAVEVHDGELYAAEWLTARTADCVAEVRCALAERAPRLLVPREQIRRRLHLDAVPFRLVVTRAVEAGVLQLAGDTAMTLPGYEPSLSRAQRHEVDHLLALLHANGHLLRSEVNLSDTALLDYLVEGNRVHDLGEGVLLDGDTFDRYTATLTAHLRTVGRITLPAARDLLGLGRRYTQLYLDYLDAHEVTRRIGDERELHSPCT